MSQIPQSRLKCPVVKTTSQSVSRIPGTNQTVTTTTTTIRENKPSGLARPVTYGGARPPQASLLRQPQIAGGIPSTSGLRQSSGYGAGNVRALQAAPCRAQPTSYRAQPAPSRAQPAPYRAQPAPYRAQPAPSRAQPAPYRAQPAPCGGQPAANRVQTAPGRVQAAAGRAQPAQGRARAPQQRIQAPVPPRPPLDIAGQYMLPMEYGPATLKGKHMTFSSPGGLRPALDKRLPQELKYFSNLPPAGVGRDRKLLEQVPQLQDTLSGRFQVYGGQPQAPTAGEESFYDLADPSLLNLNIDADETEVQLGELGLISAESSPVKTVDVYQEVLNKSLRSPSSKVTAKGGAITQVGQPRVMTPTGLQPVLQQTVLERVVERTEEGEHVSKHLTATDVNERSGEVSQVELDYQQINPHFGIEEGAPTEAITVTSTMSVTPTYTQASKTVVRVMSGDFSQIPGGIDMDPAEVQMLVDEEKEDIESTLKMVPPDLEMTEEKYALKKRLQNLRLNSESMGMLEQTVVANVPSPDEAQTAPDPEIIATIMHTVETGVTPQSPPAQVFNTLFAETTNNQYITMSSVTPGPLQDVVVPTEIPVQIHNEMINEGIQQLSNEMDKISASSEIPQVDIFTKVVPEEKQRPKKTRKRKVFKPVGEELPPWGAEDLEPIVNLVGAEPIDVLGVANVEELETSGNLNEEMAGGMEYFVDADPLQYMSRVQLRGSLLPRWFPGYMIALPEFPEVVKIAKSPSQVFFSAWKAVQPKVFTEDSSIIF